MAEFIFSEEAESAIHEADRSLVLLQGVFGSLGDRQAEVRGEDIATMLGLIQQKLATARGSARFVAQPG